MKVARGNVKKLIVILTDIQSLIGEARGAVMNDRDMMSMDKTLAALDKAFQLCIEARGEYYPTDMGYKK